MSRRQLCNYSLGPLKPDATVKLLGTMIIFLLNGCSVRSEVRRITTSCSITLARLWQELYRTILQYRIHLSIQVFSFVICPILFIVLSTIYRVATYQYQLSVG